MKIGILLDSSATASPHKFKNTIIDIIPLHINFPDGTDILDTPENFEKYEVLNKIKEGINVKTSQASPGELEKRYDILLKEYDHIYHIPITENLSSMLQTSLMVAKDEKYEGKVTVYQNKTVAAQGIEKVGEHIAKMINNESLTSPTEITDEIENFIKDIYVGIIPGDIKKLSSGGRGKSAMASVLNIFKTKILIKWEKEPKKEAFGRTYSALIERVINTYMKSYSKDYNLLFLRTQLTAQKTIDAIRSAFKERQVDFEEQIVPSIYTAHAGIETVAFIITKK